MNIAYNMDCLAAMREMKDNEFDLAVVDPPYGGAGGDFKRSDKSRFGGRFDQYKPGNAAGGGTLKATFTEPAADGRGSTPKKL